MGCDQWALLVMCGRDLGQRPGDPSRTALVRVFFEQNNTKQKVWPVVTPRLEVLLKEAKEKDIGDFGDEGIEQRTICCAERGGDYKGKRPSRVFRKIARAAGIPDEIQFRDLRRTLAQENPR
jgi:hypothetical protein